MAWVDLDVSAWNLAGAAAIGTAFACGPNVPVDGGTDGSESSSSDTTPTSLTTPPPTSMGPGPTSSPTTTPPPECLDDGDCPPGYYCYNGQCNYYCCHDDVWYYDCYAHDDCASDQYCQFNYCYTAQEIDDCGDLPLPEETLLWSGEAVGLAFTEFDGDQIPDVAISKLEGLQILFGNGFGGTDIDVAGDPGQIVSGDVDGDTDEDLLVAVDLGASWAVALVENEPAAGFPVTTPITSTIPGAQFAAADFDGNGTIDVAVLFDARIVLYSGAGDGTFAAANELVRDVQDMTAVFHDGDAAADIAAINGNYVERALGDPMFTFPFEGADEIHGAYGRRVAAADTNGDGTPAIVAIGSESGLVAQWSDVALDREEYRWLPSTMLSIATTDFREDGTESFVVGTPTGVELVWGTPTLDCRSRVFTQHEGSRVAARTTAAGQTFIAVAGGGGLTVLREDP